MRGLLAGLALAGALAAFDALAIGYLFGLQTMIFGVSAGGIMLLLGFAMSVISYVLASRGVMAELRGRLLAAAIFTGAAGMSCGFAAAGIWFAAGHPWFP